MFICIGENGMHMEPRKETGRCKSKVVYYGFVWMFMWSWGLFYHLCNNFPITCFTFFYWDEALSLFMMSVPLLTLIITLRQKCQSKIEESQNNQIGEPKAAKRLIKEWMGRPFMAPAKPANIHTYSLILYGKELHSMSLWPTCLSTQSYRRPMWRLSSLCWGLS